MSSNEFKDIKCNFNLYRSFYAVAITGSFSEAARLLYVSQPSLSYNVKQLEEQLNTNLFYRNINGVSLTNDGEKLLEHIRDAFNSIIQAEEVLSQKSEDVEGTITIGAPTHIINFYLINIIEDILQKHPNIHVKIVEKTSNSLKELLNKNLIDLVIDTSITNVDEDIIEVKGLSDERLCFAGDKLLMKDCKTVKDLSKLPLVIPTVGGFLRKVIDEYFLSYKIKVSPRIEAYTTETLLSCVQKKVGIGFFYESSIKDKLKTGELIKFEDNDEISKVPLSCAYLKKNYNPVLSIFLEQM